VIFMLSPPRVRPRCVPALQCLSNTHTPKRLDNPSHISRFPDGLESEESEDEDNDESRSTGFEEWHGLRDTTPDGAFPDGELHPILPSNPLPLPVQSSSGTAKTTLQRYYG
jgi:hypothetical protein